MRQIYRHATRTHIWLGQASSQPASQAAFGLLHDFLSVNRESLREHILKDGPERQRHDMEIYVDVRGEPPFTADPLRDYLHAEDRWWHYFQTVEHDSAQGRVTQPQNDPVHSKSSEWLSAAAKDTKYDDGWIALLEMFERPCWQRCWVVQEATTSNDLYIVCGVDSIAWEDLGLFLNLWSVQSCLEYEEIRQYDRINDSVLACWTKFSSINSLRGSPIVLTLGSCLIQQRESRATDPRDKVYAMLGLFQPFAERYSIRPSYSLNNTIVDVYTAATRAIIGVDHDIYLLNYVTGLEREAGLPSWVPHWNGPRCNELALCLDSFKADQTHNADLAFTNDERMLRVRGWIIDAIDGVGLIDNGEDPSDLLRDWISVHDNGKHVKTDLRAMDGFYRTLDFDHWSGPDPDPDGDAEKFHSCWNNTLEQWGRKSRATKGTRLFLSRNKRPGFAPGSAQVGHFVFLAYGGTVPWVIQKAEQSQYRLIGPCYLHGVMRGEIPTMEEQGKVYAEDIYLI